MRLIYSALEKKPKFGTLEPSLKLLLENTKLDYELLLNY